MTHAGPGTHDLDIARLGSPCVAQAVLMRNGALTDISDDFHVLVGMPRETAAGGNLVIIPNPDCAPTHARRITIIRKRKMLPCLQPTMIRSEERRVGKE